MKSIASFTIDHLKLLPGLYVSRKDLVNNEVITTFDLRVCRPYHEAPLGTAGIHAVEHIAATYLRNDPKWGDKIIYFGPMGCRTGFYLIVAGDYNSLDIWPLVYNCFKSIESFTDSIPGNSKQECGNCLDMDLSEARRYARSYVNTLKDINVNQLIYPK